MQLLKIDLWELYAELANFHIQRDHDIFQPPISPAPHPAMHRTISNYTVSFNIFKCLPTYIILYAICCYRNYCVYRKEWHHLTYMFVHMLETVSIH